jgi:predicted  nucleic acid-binding Zn-ribbon protein
MDPLLPQVIDLCELDREIHDLDEQLERYPKTLADLDARERAAVDRTAAAKSEHERAREARRKAELDVRALRDKIAGFALQQSRVKTNREYDAIKAEISAVEARIDEAEGRGLEALEIEERAEREMREAAEAVERLKGELAEERARIRGRRSPLWPTRRAAAAACTRSSRTSSTLASST